MKGQIISGFLGASLRQKHSDFPPPVSYEIYSLDHLLMRAQDLNN
jgi:hypothetical protein